MNKRIEKIKEIYKEEYPFNIDIQKSLYCHYCIGMPKIKTKTGEIVDPAKIALINITVSETPPTLGR